LATLLIKVLSKFFKNTTRKSSERSRKDINGGAGEETATILA